jgi:hypothetical protein
MRSYLKRGGENLLYDVGEICQVGVMPPHSNFKVMRKLVGVQPVTNQKVTTKDNSGTSMLDGWSNGHPSIASW